MVRAEPWATNMDREGPNISHKIEDRILHVTVDGLVTVSEIVTYAKDNIEVWSRSPRVLWDFRRALFPSITSETLSGLSDDFGEVFRVKSGFHTALVVRGADDLLGNMLVDLSDAYNAPVEYKAFVSLQEAQKWLQSV